MLKDFKSEVKCSLFLIIIYHCNVACVTIMLVTQLKENLCLRYQMCWGDIVTTRHQYEYEKVRTNTISNVYYSKQGDLEDKGWKVQLV